MLRKIVFKEIREVVRGRRLCLALSIVPVLLVAALTVGWNQASRFEQVQLGARHSARENWLNQGSRNPHSAAHHGTFLFKPTSPLSFFDPGLDPYLGSTIRIEAHHRHRAANVPAADSADPVRLDASSVALLLQVVLPLVIILLGFSAFSGERENGTLPMLLSLGVPRRKLLLGKAMAILLTTLALASPAALFLAWALAGDEGGLRTVDASIRAGLLAAGYAAYLGGWAFLALAASARARSSRTALIVLIAAWAISALIVPRMANDAAARLFPLPTQEEFEKRIASAIRFGTDGKTSIVDLRKRWTADLLAKYRVARKEDLPINPDGVLMQLGEEHADRCHDEADAALGTIFDRQDRWIGWCALASPFLAVRTTSMVLAGTDRLHHERFSRSAEAYRRRLIRALNEADTRRSPGGRGTENPAGRELWQRIDDFHYQEPGWAWAARAAGPGLGLLGGWLALSGALALSATRRIHGNA